MRRRFTSFKRSAGTGLARWIASYTRGIKTLRSNAAAQRQRHQRRAPPGYASQSPKGLLTPACRLIRARHRAPPAERSWRMLAFDLGALAPRAVSSNPRKAMRPGGESRRRPRL